MSSGGEGNSSNAPGARDMRDWSAKDVVIREKIINTMTEVFKRHGAIAIDTPVFEDLCVTECGDSMERCQLADQDGEQDGEQGEELGALKHDLRVPFVRWLAKNPGIKSIKGYQIGKVYQVDLREDGGSAKETYRCGFDIAGIHDSMLPDAEVLRVATEILEGVGLKEYIVRINHLGLIQGIFSVCQVPELLVKSVMKALDELEKTSWGEVLRKMVSIGLSTHSTVKLGKYITRKGGKHLLYDILLEAEFAENELISQAANDLKYLFDNLETLGVMPRVCFDLSLVRGASSHTDIIFQVATFPSLVGETEWGVLVAQTIPGTTVAHGGRYPRLLTQYSPCVGASFNLEEIVETVKQRAPEGEIRESEVDVYVIAVGNGLLKERMKVCGLLWDAGIKAEFSYKVNPGAAEQFSAAQQIGASFAVVVSEDDIKRGAVKIKEINDPHKPGLSVDLGSVTTELAKMMTKNEPGGTGGADLGGRSTPDGSFREHINEGGNFRERVDRVRVHGGTVEMEGVRIEMDFASIKTRRAEIVFEMAKFEMKNVQIEIKGEREGHAQ